ncbi:hypothetical protein [Acidovorax sp. ACV01]|uniref:hypothetical protein n=1 Tax=Acidovorax sp. ACV01 TaxID=2769311 RepID=UPI00177C1B95|nr:hypothetical protein [Acidovorax sp. ACV01]MBD9391872.1 hypothetical protein [Acidovorax sp. ACV01]
MADSFPPLKPGDAVVPLANLAIQCGSISGAASVGLVLSRLNSAWGPMFIGALAGAFVGAAIGWALGRLWFPASSGQVFVVRAGRSALLLTLRAALAPALLAGIGLSILAAVSFGASAWPYAVLSGAMVAVAVGLLFGLGSALA